MQKSLTDFHCNYINLFNSVKYRLIQLIKTIFKCFYIIIHYIYLPIYTILSLFYDRTLYVFYVFKALLFLAAGAVIHGITDQQDLRRLGGLVGFMPLTYTTILVGSLSLMALPWLTGFYSKDLLLELAYGRYLASGTLAYWLGTFAAGCTAFYTFRLVSLAFFVVPNA